MTNPGHRSSRRDPDMKAFAFSFGASLTLGLAIWFYLEMWK